MDYRIHDKVYTQDLCQRDAFAVQGWDGDSTYTQLADVANNLRFILLALASN